MERGYHLSQLVDPTYFDAIQECVWLSGLQMHITWSHCSSQQPTSTPKSFPRGCSQFSAQPVFLLGIAPTHVQDLACSLGLHDVHAGALLNPVQSALDSSPFLQIVACTALGVIKHAEGTLCPTVHAMTKMLKYSQSQY